MTPRSLPSGWSEAEASLWGWHAVGSKRKGPGGTCWPQVTKQPPAKGTAGGPLLLGTLSLKPVWSEQERSCSLSALTRRRHQLQAVTRDTGLETCDASPPRLSLEEARQGPDRCLLSCSLGSRSKGDQSRPLPGRLGVSKATYRCERASASRLSQKGEDRESPSEQVEIADSWALQS